MGFVHEEGLSSPEFTIEDINGCSDVAQLVQWLEETDNSFDDMVAQVEAAKMTGCFDESWMDRVRRAIGFQGMGRNRIKKRLLKLGVNPEPRLPKSEAEELHGELLNVKASLAKARASAAFGRHLLDAVKRHVDPAVVAVIVSSASTQAVAEDEQPARAA